MAGTHAGPITIISQYHYQYSMLEY
eukprot:SAG31_NODE_47465_length_241_cov_4.302817_1_plen_24_part_01